MDTHDLEGGCACDAVRYRITDSPLVVHACHCRDCQRLTGSAFVVNLWIEADRMARLAGAPRACRLAGGSGKDHEVFFCGTCGTTLWSRYHSVPGHCLFVRAGTLDDPSGVAPDVHIFTASKLPWLELPAGARRFERMYRLREVWSAEKLARLDANAGGSRAAGGRP